MGDRVVALGEHLERERRPRRMVDQLIGSGTSPGANAFEAHEAVSRADFLKSVGTLVKELHETVFWLRLIGRRGYVPEPRLNELLAETRELLAIFKTMIARSRRNGPS